MQLGALSISLSVANLQASQSFYRQLGFIEIGGNAAENWLVLRNGDHVIGLFQGMFEKNTITFNPGWDQQGENLDPFTDVRDLQRELKRRGLTVLSEADERTSGPGSCVLEDPDGNPILIDQHR